MSEKKDGGVVRSQLQKGEGYLTPKEGATCDGIISDSAYLLLCRQNVAILSFSKIEKQYLYCAWPVPVIFIPGSSLGNQGNMPAKTENKI